MKSNWQDELKELLYCDLKTLYPLARDINRELEFYVGPTNSGKTYSAMSELKKSNSGLYLAPLRLLALEGYEDLKASNINASLVTGEEQIIDEEATHICSTIEMLDFDLEVDVAIIDEVQMLDDEDRGWAWVNAIIGAPAKKVIMTGSVNALEAIKKIANYLGEDLKIVKHKRKNELVVLDKATAFNNLEPNSALIAFSRSDVLKLKQKLQKNYTVSVIYGNLSPEVRKDEAKKFRDGKSQILIATDAIAMGLNLPIKNILFTTHTKFDGVKKRAISTNEIVQISGRAGRYKLFDNGYIGATKKDVLSYIQNKIKEPIKSIKPPFKVKINSSQLDGLATYLQTNSLTKLLNYFAKNMEFSGPFVATNISSMIEASQILDKKDSLSLEEKYILSQAPITTKSKIILQAFDSYIATVVKKRVNHYKPSITLPKKAVTQQDLLLVEDEVKKISLYLWLSYKFPELFPDYDKAFILRNSFNSFIEKSLKSSLVDREKVVNSSRYMQFGKKRFSNRNNKKNDKNIDDKKRKINKKF